MMGTMHFGRAGACFYGEGTRLALRTRLDLFIVERGNSTLGLVGELGRTGAVRAW